LLSEPIDKQHISSTEKGISGRSLFQPKVWTDLPVQPDFMLLKSFLHLSFFLGMVGGHSHYIMK